MLAVLALIAWVRGDMPLRLGICALIFIPAACVASFEALNLLSDPYKPPYLWPILVPATAPPFVVLFCFWALAPSLRRSIPPAIVGGSVFGVIFVLCAALYPMEKMREAVNQKEVEALQRYDDDYAALNPNAPLWDWVRFLNTRNDTLRSTILKRMGVLERRQSDAEIMLDRGDFPLGVINSLDLDPTPAVCDKARAQLRKQAAALMPAKPGVKKYTEVAVQVSDALAALKWLIGYGCNSDVEVTAWENMANSYVDTNYDIYELRDLHDPKLLGKVLRESPERFSMLTPQSHLSAWLKFAADDKLRDQALAGARKLPNRSKDAGEIAMEGGYTAFPLTKYLPELDLEISSPLCNGMRKSIRERISMIYKPKPEDRMSYKEFLDRLGEEAPLTDLLWLAGHGCDMDGLLVYTEDLIGAYQDTQARAAMLAKLASLHRKL
jgi:hypothetical protein